MVERTRRNSRIGAAVAALALQAMVGYALLFGLAVAVPIPVRDAISVFEVALPPPPSRPRPAGVRRHRKSSRAAPNFATEPLTVAEAPAIAPLDMPPIAAAPSPDTGAAAAGVEGGTGGDGGDGDWTPSQWRRGEITRADYPRAAAAAGVGGTLTTRYVVATTGRVTECTVTRSSGNADLDATTCRLIRKRFRFRPARDASGRVIPDVVTEEHVWRIEG